MQDSQIVSKTSVLGGSLRPGNALKNSSASATEIQAWVVAYLADLLEVEPDEVDPTIPFDRYGLDSSAAVGLTGDLEDWLGREIDPTLLYDYPTVEGLVKHLNSTLEP
jgi:acyl carrier protein